MSTLITFLPISYLVLASPFCICLVPVSPTWPKDSEFSASLRGPQQDGVFAEATDWLRALTVMCSVSEGNVLGSLGMSVCSLSDLQRVTSNPRTEDACLVLWIHFSFTVTLKKKKKNLVNLKAWSESLSPTAVKFHVKVAVLKAYLILQIPLFVPVVVFTTLFLFNYGFP